MKREILVQFQIPQPTFKKALYKPLKIAYLEIIEARKDMLPEIVQNAISLVTEKVVKIQEEGNEGFYIHYLNNGDEVCEVYVAVSAMNDKWTLYACSENCSDNDWVIIQSFLRNS